MRKMTTATLLAAALPAAVLAQPQQALNTAALSATCATCHGTRGHAVEAATLPSLAGMPAPQMLTQLRAFRDGSRPATIMHQLVKGFSDRQLEQIAGYFAVQK